MFGLEKKKKKVKAVLELGSDFVDLIVNNRARVPPYTLPEQQLENF